MTHREIILEESIRALQKQIRVLRDENEDLAGQVRYWRDHCERAEAELDRSIPFVPTWLEG